MVFGGARVLQRAIWWCGNLPEMVENVLQNACSLTRYLMTRFGSRIVNSVNMCFYRGISAYLGDPGRQCDGMAVRGVTEDDGPNP